MNTKNGLPGGKHTLVEEGTEFKGTLSSKCPIVVMGKVEGDITGPIIQVTTTGVVAGNVRVQELHSAGELAGDVQAESVRISGRVRDKTVIRARTLEVSLTATTKGTGMEVIFGDCELAIGDEPNKEAAVAAALAAPTPTPTPTATAPDAKPAAGKDAAKKGGPATAPATAETKPAESPEDEAKRKRSGTMPPPLA